MDLETRYKKTAPIILGALTGIPVSGIFMGWPPTGAIIFAFGVFIVPMIGYLFNPGE